MDFSFDDFIVGNEYYTVVFNEHKHDEPDHYSLLLVRLIGVNVFLNGCAEYIVYNLSDEKTKTVSSSFIFTEYIFAKDYIVNILSSIEDKNIRT